jgi:small-conductance mechanosensitive channel
VKQRHHNRRKKVSDLLFDLAKYLLTVIGVGAVLPESKLSTTTVVFGLALTLVILIVGLLITPEERD